MRVKIRVYPGSRETSVGGRYGEGGPPVLIVRVTAPAVDGKANRAVIEAVARALGVRSRDLRIVAGERSRDKIIEITGVDAPAIANLLAR